MLSPKVNCSCAMFSQVIRLTSIFSYAALLYNCIALFSVIGISHNLPFFVIATTEIVLMILCAHLVTKTHVVNYVPQIVTERGVIDG